MKHRFFFFVFILLSLFTSNQAFSYEQGGASAVDPVVDKTLSQMCDYLKSAGQTRSVLRLPLKKFLIQVRR